MREEYIQLAHAMQSGVALVMEQGGKGTEPKHLRVGINSAMVEHGALVGLLLEKGVITPEEDFESLLKYMQIEVDKYQEVVTKIFGENVNVQLR